MVLPAFDRAAGAFWMPPAGTRYIGPPAADVTQVHGTSEHEENRAAWGQETGIGTGIGGRIERAFGDGSLPGCRDESGEVGIGHEVLVDPEATDGYCMRRRFLGVCIVVAHPERATGNPAHADWWGHVHGTAVRFCEIGHGGIES
jgi:hypothetical protein